MSSNVQQHQAMMNDFIELANQLKDTGNEPQLVSASMMSAAAVYTTYVHAGNDGYLQESGIVKVVNAFEKHIRQVQAFKQAQSLQNQAIQQQSQS